MRLRLHPLAATGISLLVCNASAAVRHVDLHGTKPTPPYTNWITAATNIQAAVDAANVGDTVLVTNGTYQTGTLVYGGATNRVAVTKALWLQSVNGADETVIRGSQTTGPNTGEGAVRCVYLAAGATLVGFTLVNGAGGVVCESTAAVVSNCVLTANASGGGGGACRGTLYDCVITNNQAAYGAGAAGGSLDGSETYACVLNRCTVSGNNADNYGGAAYFCTLNDCSIRDNTARFGGGVYFGTLLRCGLTNNSASFGGGAAFSAFLSSCFVVNNSAPQAGGVGPGSQLTDCVVAGNWADDVGGGAQGATLSNCTLSNNAAGSGGGAYSCTLFQCRLQGNTAQAGGGAARGILSDCILTDNSGDSGGGTYASTLNNCLVSSNSATSTGGGACASILNNCLLTGNSTLGLGGAAAEDPFYPSVLNNCTVAGNSALTGAGGAYLGTLNNCIVVDNTAPSDPNYSSWDSSGPAGSVLNYCCTLPLPPPCAGSNNFTGPVLFVDEAGGNFRLQTNSPCVNAGFNGFVTNTPDLDGNLRIVGPAVDVGAYEFQGPPLAVFRAWLKFYGLPSDGSADYADSDGEGLNNWQEWIAGTVPTNALSVLRMSSAVAGASGITVTWQSVSNRIYFLQRSTNLLTSPAFLPIGSDIPGQPATTIFTDTSANGAGPYFYRVGVQQ